MKPSFLTTQVYLVVLSLLVATMHLQCTGQQPPNPADSTQVQSELVRPPRIYGAYTLEWDRYVGPFYRDTVIIDTVQYFLEEQAPGIVCWFRGATMYPGFYYKKIEYYDTLSKTLLKSVDLEQLNQYLNGQHTPISLGNFDWDYMNLPEEPDSNCVFAKLPPSQYYSTYNDIRLLSDAGYYMVGNYLIGYYRDEGAAVHVVSWESTVIILNPQGEEVLRIKPDHTFYAALVTDNGRLCKNPVHPSPPSLSPGNCRMTGLTAGKVTHDVFHAPWPSTAGHSTKIAHFELFSPSPSSMSSFLAP